MAITISAGWRNSSASADLSHQRKDCKRRGTLFHAVFAVTISPRDATSLRNLNEGYGDKSIHVGVEFQRRRKERSCVLGANGAGKSTPRKPVAGTTEPTQGTVSVGTSLKTSYLARHSKHLLDGDETNDHLDTGTKEMRVAALAEFKGAMLFVSRNRHCLAALSIRMLELTPAGVRQFSCGYAEHMVRTGQEAPGLHLADNRDDCVGVRRL
jgi:ATPase subunit of ABC transporter with duplicated ATPase domains